MRIENTQTTTLIYKLDELDESVQETVIEGWHTNDKFFAADEWHQSLEAFANRFDVTVNDWSVDLCNSYIKSDHTPAPEKIGRAHV
mgnify:CR=1 FL=1